MPRRQTLSIALTTVAAVTALVLAGCSSSPVGGDLDGSGSEDEQPSQEQATTVYDFPLNGMAPVGKGEQLTVILPDDLKQAAGEEASKVVVESFTVSSHELQTADHCGVDISVQFVSDEARTTVLDSYDTREDYKDETDGQKVARATMYREDVSTLDELDEADPKSGIYAAEDGSQIVRVSKCASSPQDDDAFITLGFSYPKKPDYPGDTITTYKPFAVASLAVMTDGSVSVASASTDDWTRDSSGNWIKD